MRRGSSPFWRVLSLPWLVSANLHAVVVLLLMCTLTPLDEPPPPRVELSLGEAAPPVELEAEVEVTLSRPPEMSRSDRVAASAVVREIEIEPAQPLQDVAEASPSSAASPPIETLMTRVVRPLDERFGFAGVGLSQGGAVSAGGASGEAAFFGTTAFGKRFVYILDMSGSMKKGGDRTAAGCRFRRAVEELLASIDRLAPDQMFYVYLFSTATRPLFDEPPLNPVWRPATAEVKSLLRAWLATIEPGGGTDPRLAIHLAAALQPDALFLLSDGRFNGKEQKMVRGVERLSRNSEQRGSSGIVPVHTFAFEDALACHSLQSLALATGGVYRFIPPIFRQGKHDDTPPIKPEVYAENLLKTAESLIGAGRAAEAMEIYRTVLRDFPDTPAAEEALSRSTSRSGQL